jgi:nitrogen-specific signal transduction histidine kinase
MATLLLPPTETGHAHNEFIGPETDEPAVFTLDANGLIRTCNKAAGQLLGCPSSTLVWQHVSNILPQLSGTTLMQDGHINPRLRFLSRIGHRFQLTIPDGKHDSGRIFINDLENSGRHIVRLIVYPDGRPTLGDGPQPH